MSAYSDLVLASSPNAYWRLGESAGTAAASEVNNTTMVGVYQGAYVLGHGSLLSADTANTSVGFTSASSSNVVANGTGGFSVHEALQDVGDVFTIEFWLKRASISSGNPTPYSNGGAPSFCVRFNADNTLRLDKEVTSVVVSSTVAIADTSTAHHCVITKNGATSKVYIDGADVTGTVTDATMGNPTSRWSIGVDVGGVNGFNGDLDEVALYPTALSAATVLSHYQAGAVIVAGFIPQAARVRYT